MGNAIVSFVGDMATHYIIFFYCIRSVVKRIAQTIQQTIALEVESSSLSISQVSCPEGICYT